MAPGKLAKLFKKHQRTSKPVAKKVDLNRGVAQVPPGADLPYVRDFYKRRETVEDHKKVEAQFKNKKFEVKIDGDDAGVEIIHCPSTVKYIRITDTLSTKDGEKAGIEAILKNPTKYPHISFHGQDDVGRTIIRRRMLDPKVLEEMRAAVIKRQKDSCTAPSKATRDADTPQRRKPPPKNTINDVAQKDTEVPSKKRSHDDAEGSAEQEPISQEDRPVKRMKTIAGTTNGNAGATKDTAIAGTKRARGDNGGPEEQEPPRRKVRYIKRKTAPVAAATITTIIDTTTTEGGKVE